jgi:hypothetical protein
MKLEIDKLSALGTPTTAIISHGERAIYWNVALFDKTSYSGDFDIFEQINGYWASLPMPRQDAIFAVYQQIREAFDTIWDTNELTMKLYQLIHDLYELHPLKELGHWLYFHGNLSMPASVRNSFDENNDGSVRRETTYVAPDYRELVALSVGLRVMIPIWGVFISHTKGTVGNAFKEYYAYQLLTHTNLIHSEAMDRLRVYVERSLPADKSKSAAILGGLSSEDFPIWMLGLVLVRRLSIGDVRGLDPKSNLITFIYKYIDQKAKGSDNSFVGVVKEKKVEGVGQEGENNLSKLEGYKIKQEIPQGDIAILSYPVQDAFRVAQKICPDIPAELIKQSLESTQALGNSQIWHPQTTLAQWVLAPAIPPRGMLHLSKQLTVYAMAAAQACLWHRGHHEIAALMTALEQDNRDAQQLPGTDSRARIQKEQLELLDKLYPYSRKLTGKKQAPKKANPAVEAIDSISTSLSQHAWRLTLPADWVQQITGNKNNRRYSVPADIKIKLANLAIAIAQRSF